MSRLYGSVNINVDVDLSDIYDDMSRSQKTEFADKLQDDGFLECDCEDELRVVEENIGLSRIKNDEWSTECVRLSNLYYNLSDEDIQTIKGIIKKHI
jgi:hypothetical protein